MIASRRAPGGSSFLLSRGVARKGICFRFPMAKGDAKLPGEFCWHREDLLATRHVAVPHLWRLGAKRPWQCPANRLKAVWRIDFVTSNWSHRREASVARGHTPPSDNKSCFSETGMVSLICRWSCALGNVS